MRILHILNHSVPSADGYCVRSANIVKFQRELGWDPIVVTSPHHEPIPTEKVEIFDGIKYYRAPPSNSRRIPFLHEAMAIRCLRKRIDEILIEEQIDVLHAHSPCLWGVAGYYAARRRRLPFVYEMRSFWQGIGVRLNPVSWLKYRVGAKLECYVANRAGAVAAISDHLRKELSDRGVDSRKLILTPNGVDVSRFPPVAPDKELRKKLGCTGPVLGYLGSLSGWEGVEDLIQAMRIIRKEIPGCKLLIVGGGERESALRSLVKELQLEDSIEMVGRVPHQEVTKFYSIMDLIVYPRRRNKITENVTPLKPLEAMAMGKPILCSNVGGLRELLPSDSELFFEADNVESLSSKCCELLRSNALGATGNRLRKHVLAERDWKQMIKRYESLYKLAGVNLKEDS